MVQGWVKLFPPALSSIVCPEFWVHLPLLPRCCGSLFLFLAEGRAGLSDAVLIYASVISNKRTMKLPLRAELKEHPVFCESTMDSGSIFLLPSWNWEWWFDCTHASWDCTVSLRSWLSLESQSTWILGFTPFTEKKKKKVKIFQHCVPLWKSHSCSQNKMFWPYSHKIAS